MEEIKEDKEKNFIRRQKERLFAIVDHVDKIDLTTHLHLRSSAQEDQEVQEVNEHTQMTNKVKLYRQKITFTAGGSFINCQEINYPKNVQTD